MLEPGRSRNLFKVALKTALGICIGVAPHWASTALGQTAPQASASSQLPSNWREIKDGVGGYPAGPMLEIALRRTHADKLEMFKWRSEAISMLSAQPGPLVEREWRSVSGLPKNTGAGTWTGMTWWENQQKWHDMANILFPTPAFKKWLQTLDMTLIFVKPLDSNFDLRTLAQSGKQVLELGLLVFPTSSKNAAIGNDPAAAQTYVEALKRNGAESYRFAIYPNPGGFNGPFTVAYNKSGPPSTTGERWFVYMASYESEDARRRLQSIDEVRVAFEALTGSVVKEHSDIQVMTRTTSLVCIKKTTGTCSLDPDDCQVGEMGSGDTWAASCGEQSAACMTSYGVCSQLPPRTCGAVGGRLMAACPTTARP